MKLRALILINILLILCFQNCGGNLESSGSSAPTFKFGVQTVKWYPGHYYHVMGGDLKVTSFVMKEAYNEMNVPNSGITGIQLRLSWKDLEPSLGDYTAGFDIIDNHLKKLELTNKKLFLFIAHKGGLMPDYLKANPIYDGGSFNFTSSINNTVDGESAKFWNPFVRDRFVALIAALGSRYNTDLRFVGVALPETAMGIPIPAGSVTAAQEDAYYQALLYINQKMRMAFPNTITTQFTNYPRSMLAEFVTRLKDMGAGLGGPDVWLNDSGVNAFNVLNQADGVYSYYKKFFGVIPMTPSVMSGNFRRTIADASDPNNRQPSVDELLDFARDQLNANIIFWSRDTEAPTYYYKNVLTMLNTLTQSQNPRVQLQTSCPTQYAQCVSD